ncbi:hypothetical protein TRIUR3_33974 [Triticum urartu]|uniref:DUF6598 domain-containing protein n=1 Tax=Triticum urartu TaxID=4572 RepID=M7YL86_TRIUA|nr:hypothetical protein TRIUR3_33974 [Triticum urartu]
MALRSGRILGDEKPIGEKRRGILRSRMSLDRDNPNEEKRIGIERGGAQAIDSSTAPRSRVALGADGFPLDGVTRGELLGNLKHADGSIYTSNSYWAKVYRLYDTSESEMDNILLVVGPPLIGERGAILLDDAPVPSLFKSVLNPLFSQSAAYLRTAHILTEVTSACLESMMTTVPYDSCMPNWRVCKRHAYRTMMQIFSLKLAYTSSYVSGPVQLYGYVAVRDLLNPMRNYVFNRTRNDPLVVEHDGFIQMSGPKRGIRMQAPVLIEFDLKIKTEGEEEGDDQQVIDGVAIFGDRISGHARVNTQRMDGDGGSVDIKFAVLERASEATVQVGISEIEKGSCLSLCLAGSYTSPSYVSHGKIQLFDGVITAEASELSRTVVAVARDSKLVVKLKLSQKGGLDIHRCTIFPVEKHGSQSFIFNLGVATVEVMVTWSTMDIPQSLLGPNCFAHEFMASEGVEYVDE